MPAIRIDVAPTLLRWARERARIPSSRLARAFPHLEEWEAGTAKPTLKQLESFARKTSAPIGYFFLSEPPEELLPIPDLRPIRDEPAVRSSADLLNTIYTCQNRQEWFSHYLRTEDHEPLAFVGSITFGGDIEASADLMRRQLGFGVSARKRISFAFAFRALRQRAEELGILVMTSSIAGSASKRRLDSKEFRGFALVDDYAPLVFVNTADSIAVQTMTLALELVHVWTGRSGVTGGASMTTDGGEQWCKAVAADLLVSVSVHREGRRLGTAPVVNRKFVRAVVSSTLEGSTTYREAFRLLSIKNARTLHEIGRLVGVVM